MGMRVPAIVGRLPLPRGLSVFLLFAAIAVLAASLRFLGSQEIHARRDAEDDLLAIEQLKVGQIVHWRSDQLAAGEQLMGDSCCVEFIQAWVEDPEDAQNSSAVLTLLENIRKTHDYRTIQVVDRGGGILLNPEGGTGAFHDEAAGYLLQAFESRAPVLTDLRLGQDSIPRIAVITPLFSSGAGSEPLVAVIFVLDPGQFLFPLVEEWPLPSRSAEAALVRRDQDSVVFLNNLRFRAGSALTYRIPVSDTDLPAVMAVLGREGIVTGRDYRGEEVLAALAPIPGSNWFMVAKIDASEALAAWRLNSLLLILLVACLAGAAVSSALLLMQREAKQRFRDLLLAEEARRIGEERFQRVFEASSVGISLTSTDGVLARVNGALCAMLGYSGEELHTKGFADVTHSDDVAASWEHVRMLLAGEAQTCRFEKRFIRKDGCILWADVSTTLLRDADGRPLHLITHIVDITARKQAEAQLLRVEERHRTTLLSVGDGVIVTDLDGRVELINPVAERLTGWLSREAVGKPLSDVFRIVNEETRRPIASAVAKVIGEGLVVGLANHTLLVSRDGREIPIADSGAPIRDISGEISGVVLVFRDQTMEREAERVLRESETKFVSIFETSPYAMTITAARDGRILDVNRSFEVITGFGRDEVIGRSTIDLGLWHDDADRAEVVDALFKTGFVHAREYRFRVKSGDLISGQFFANLIDVAGEKCVLSSIDDVTNRKKAEDLLKASERKYRTLVETADDAILLTDLGGRHLYRNDAYCSSLGYEDGIEPPLDGFALVHPDDLDSQKASLRETLDKGEASFEFRLRHRDGRWICCQARSVVILGAEDKPEAILSIVRDVTDRRQAEEALLAQHLRWKATFDATGDAICLLDSQSRIIQLNRAMIAQFGLSEEEMLGRRCWEVIHDTLLPIPDCPVLRMQESRQREFLEIARGDRWLSISVDPVLTPDGFLIGGVHIIRDITDRRLLEEALRRDEEKFRTVADWTYDWELWKDPSGRLLYTSPSSERVSGYTRDEILTDPDLLDSMIHPDDRAFWERHVQQHLTNLGDALSFEMRIVAKDGGIRWIEHCCRPVFGLDGRNLGMRSSNRSITEHKLAEEALRLSEEKYRTLVENSNESIIIAQDAALVFANRQAIGMLGSPWAELAGRPFAQFIHPDDRQLVSDRYARRIRGESIPASYDFRILGGEGRIYWVQINAVLIEWCGKPATLNFLTDITERKAAEELLRKSENLLSRVFDILPIGLWFADGSGKLSKGNPEGVRIWGAEPMVSPEGYGIFKARRLPSGEEITLSDWALAHTVREGASITNEMLEIDAFDCVKRVILNSTAPVLDSSGKIEGAVVVNLDITDKQKLEEQLQQAQKMESVGRLAGGVAHDFNNMLGVILGHAERAIAKAGGNEALDHDLQEILRAAVRSAELTSQLLAFARKQTISPRVIDLNEAISGMLSMLRRLVGEDVDLRLSPQSDLWPVRIDPAQLNQVLANLIVNARDAISGNGRILVETANIAAGAGDAPKAGEMPEGDYAMFAISDNGCGMDRETFSHLFEPFFTTKEVGKGTGLGLAMVYGIVKQNGGFITAYSEPGHGTTFRIYFPSLRGSGGSIPAQRAPQRLSGGTETILIVEDETAVLELGREILEELGYRVLAASTPSQALSIAREHPEPIHLLITDVVMPEMNGKQIAAALMAFKPDLRCLFMSGYTANVIAHHSILEDGVRFVQKPFSISSLAEKVREALEAPE